LLCENSRGRTSVRAKLQKSFRQKKERQTGNVGGRPEDSVKRVKGEGVLSKEGLAGNGSHEEIREVTFKKPADQRINKA